MEVFHKIINPEHWILSYGFTEKIKTVIGLPCQYEICVESKSKLFNVWVGVDFKKRLVHIYREYECGGEVNRKTYDFSTVDVDEEYDFMIELDTIVSNYVNDTWEDQLVEKYYRVSDIKEIIKKLAREPYYQHDGESFYNGVCAVDGELMFIESVEFEEPKKCTKGLHLGHNYYCSNCGQLAPIYNYCAYCGAKVQEG